MELQSSQGKVSNDLCCFFILQNHQAQGSDLLNGQRDKRPAILQ